jgi:hypothetical protein
MLTRWKVCVQWNRVIVLREQARSHKGLWALRIIVGASLLAKASAIAPHIF